MSATHTQTLWMRMEFPVSKLDHLTTDDGLAEIKADAAANFLAIVASWQRAVEREKSSQPSESSGNWLPEAKQTER